MAHQQSHNPPARNPPARRVCTFVGPLLAVALAAPAPAHASAQAPGAAPPRGDDGRIGRAAAPLELAEPAELALPPAPANAEAQRLRDAGRFGEAAAIYESALASGGDDRLAYHAGVARSLAGQHALALQHFTRWLERAGAAAEATRRHVAAKQAAEQALTVPIRLAIVEAGGRPVAPERLATGRVTLMPLAAGPVSSAILVVPGYRGEQLRVDPGPWFARVDLPGYMPAEIQRSALGPDETVWELAVAAQRVTVDLRFTPVNALRGAQLRVSPVAPTTGATLTRPLESPATSVVLTTGTWQVDVTARRHETHFPVTVAAGMRPVEVTLHRRSRTDRPRFTRNGTLVGALLGAAFLEVVSGATVTIVGGVREARAHDRNETVLLESLQDAASANPGSPTGLARVEAEYSTAGFHRDISRAHTLQTAGLVVTFVGLGTVLATFPVAAEARRRAAYIEMGVGAAMLGGGAAWLASALHDDRALLAADSPDGRVTTSDLKPFDRHRVGASVVLGVGIGLVITPAVALVADALTKRKASRRAARLAPFMAPGQAGLALHGRF